MKIKDPEYVGQSKTLISNPNQIEMTEGISITDQMIITKYLDESEIEHVSLAIDYFTRALKFYKIIIVMPRIAAHISYWLSELYSKNGDKEISYKMKVDLQKRLHGWNTPLISIIQGLLNSSDNQIDEVVQWLLLNTGLNSLKSLDSFQEIKQILTAQIVQLKFKCPENLLTVEANFRPKRISTYNSTYLEIRILSQFPDILEPVKVSLIFSDNTFNRDIEEPISLVPGQHRLISNKILVKSGLVSVIELIKIVLTYEPAPMSMLALEVDILAKLYVNPPAAKLLPAFQHSPPALIAEYYSVEITLNA